MYSVAISLLPSIKILRNEDTTIYAPKEKCLGEGIFGICYLGIFNHYQVCVKKYKTSRTDSFVNEANILSKFNHKNLPYLFGIIIGDHPSLVTSYHGFGDESVTLHCAVRSKPHQTTKKILDSSYTWINVLAQITEGLTCLHNKYKVIHNDIKMDNICLSLTITSQIKVVIIDFGKACNTDKGKLYKLTDHEKEQYKVCHSHIAPDLRNGLCRQSAMSDVYALGRIINTVNGISYLQNKDLQEFSETCMHYNEKSRPEMSAIENYINQLLHMNVQ